MAAVQLEAGLVSVVVPCYNHAPYVEECLASVREQQYPAMEILVFDDGSRDGSADIIAPLAERYGFYFRAQKNQGLSRTLNDALTMARGEFVAPFASDDVMYPDRLQKQVEFLQAHPDVGIVSGQVTRIDEHGNEYRKQDERPAKTRFLSFDDIFLGRSGRLAATGMLYRRTAIDEAGGFRDEIAVEDLYMQLRIAHAGWRLADTPDVVARYRVHSSNTMRNTAFLYENIGRIYDDYREHPQYARVRRRYMNGMLLRAAGTDKQLARRIWHDMRWSDCNGRTLRGLWRLYFRKIRGR
ncbi:MAG TPA: glycosyltransferase [Pseudomonadales bacterium]|nr:glycosyltransferase [Pseudomonadales bacterium]